jgi:hypothetical protein
MIAPGWGLPGLSRVLHPATGTHQMRFKVIPAPSVHTPPYQRMTRNSKSPPLNNFAHPNRLTRVLDLAADAQIDAVKYAGHADEDGRLERADVVNDLGGVTLGLGWVGWGGVGGGGFGRRRGRGIRARLKEAGAFADTLPASQSRAFRAAQSRACPVEGLRSSRGAGARTWKYPMRPPM